MTKIIISKTEISVSSMEESIGVELARKSKNSDKTEKVWAILPKIEIQSETFSANAVDEILKDWIQSTRMEMIRAKTKEAVEEGKVEVEIQFSCESLLEFWRQKNASLRLNVTSVKEWFQASAVLEAIVEKLAEKPEGQIEQTVAKVQKLLESCAAPNPAITPQVATKLVEYFEKESSLIGLAVLRKLQLVASKKAVELLDL